jgi:hypothetical protein
MRKKWMFLAGFFLVFGGFFFAHHDPGPEIEEPSVLILRSSCPPGFKKDAHNRCINKNLYLQYAIPNAPGLPQIGRTITTRLLYDF